MSESLRHIVFSAESEEESDVLSTGPVFRLESSQPDTDRSIPPIQQETIIYSLAVSMCLYIIVLLFVVSIDTDKAFIGTEALSRLSQAKAWVSCTGYECCLIGSFDLMKQEQKAAHV